MSRSAAHDSTLTKRRDVSRVRFGAHARFAIQKPARKNLPTRKRTRMTDRLQYGATAKVFHWLVVALLLVQYPIGWLMPDIHRGIKPGAAMTFHVSFGIVILV